MAGYRHIVLFRLRPGTTAAQRADALAALRRLGTSAGAREWRVEESLDRRKGDVLVEVALFDSEADFQAFRGSAAHRETAELLAGIADWTVGDHVE